MTNQEAIRELMFAKREVIADSFIDKAYDMAISALKAHGTCEDAVSRQTLQKELALYLIDDITSEDEVGYNRAINDVQKMVLHLPSAQPELAQNLHNACTDLISRQAAIEWCLEGLNNMPSAQPDMSEYSSKLWRNAYERGKRDAQSEEDCDTCKHGYFGDDQCNNCRVRYPSHYERRTDESD